MESMVGKGMGVIVEDLLRVIKKGKVEEVRKAVGDGVKDGEVKYDLL